MITKVILSQTVDSKRLFANSTAKYTVLQERAPFGGLVRAVRANMPPCHHILFVSMINVFLF